MTQANEEYSAQTRVQLILGTRLRRACQFRRTVSGFGPVRCTASRLRIELSFTLPVPILNSSLKIAPKQLIRNSRIASPIPTIF